MDGIASAVVLPDQDIGSSPQATASSSTGLKRRPSFISEHDTKRPRLGNDTPPLERRESVSSTKTSISAPKARERGRERRLFGAVLGALSQNSASAGQKRRAEIEKRQQAQRKLDEEESEQRKLERRARCKAQRWREHRRFERDSMRIRHDNLLAMARFLRTTTEPRLYYKPWETTQREDDLIRDQIAEAQAVIRQEREDYEASIQRYVERERHASREGYTGDHAEDTTSGKDYEANMSVDTTAANGHATSGSYISPDDQEQNVDHANAHADKELSTMLDTSVGHGVAADDIGKEAMDENGEEVVEAAEDTVIY